MLSPVQLSCGSAGQSYPREAIDRFIDENKALIKRMYGEPQETVKTSVRVVRTYSQENKRFRREVLEGTLEELLGEVGIYFITEKYFIAVY